MALAQVSAGLDSAEAAYAERLHRWQEDVIARVKAAARKDDGAGIIANGLEFEGESSKKTLSNDLINLRTKTANFGRGQLNKELKRQQARRSTNAQQT